MPTELQISRFARLTMRALEIKRTLGTRRAAGYLRNRDVPLTIAVVMLAARPRAA